jgi:hypothetical protein
VHFDGPLRPGSTSKLPWFGNANNRRLVFTKTVTSIGSLCRTGAALGTIRFRPDQVTYSASPATLYDLFNRPIAPFIAFPLAMI